MRLDKKHFIKHQDTNLDQILTFNDDWVKRALPISKVNEVSIKGKIKYKDSLEELILDAEVNFDIECVSLKTLEKYNLESSFAINEVYSFNQKAKDCEIIDEDVFELEAIVFNLILEQIPMENSKKNDTITKVSEEIILLSEAEYQKQKSSQTDPRWDKLKDLIK